MRMKFFAHFAHQANLRMDRKDATSADASISIRCSRASHFNTQLHLELPRAYFWAHTLTPEHVEPRLSDDE